jgi:rhodanese-related sulfurtransferase
MNKPVVVYCEAGGRARRVETALREAGFTELLHLEGDMRSWKANNRPLEK